MIFRFLKSYIMLRRRKIRIGTRKIELNTAPMMNLLLELDVELIRFKNSNTWIVVDWIKLVVEN